MMKLRNLTLNPDLLMPNKEVCRGKTCFIAQSQQLDEILYNVFGRPNLCLKVFYKVTHTQTEVRDPDEYLWAMDVSLTESTKVQNLAARAGLAPRVYAIVLVNDRFLAQVTDFLGSKEGQPNLDKLEQVKAHFEIGLGWDYGVADFNAHKLNWVGDKIVDFGGACFHKPNEYQQSLIERSRTLMRQGKLIRPPKPYQPIADFTLEGLRGPMSNRIEALHFNDINLEGKTFLDLGCNNGAFCREATSRGAWRVVGIDVPVISDVAYEVSNWLGFWNLDFLGLELPVDSTKIKERCGIGKFDVVLALSVLGHVRGHYQPWVAGLCASLFFLEGHNLESEATYREQLSSDFEIVDYLGTIQDGGRRPIFKCHI